MAVRRPLVVIDGRLQELPLLDEVPGGVWLGDATPASGIYRHWLTTANVYSISDDGVTWFQVNDGNEGADWGDITNKPATFPSTIAQVTGLAAALVAASFYYGDTAPDPNVYKRWITSTLDEYAYVDGGWAQLGGSGVDGREIELQVATNLLQWRYVGGASWTTLFDLSTLGGSSDPITLATNNATPSAPATNNIAIFGRAIAGRAFPAFIGPSGLDSALQPLLARNKVGYWNPPGNATTVPGVFGFTAPTVTNFTATARNVATTNVFTRMRRLGYVTAATAGAVGHWRVAQYQYTTGGASGLGGFTYIKRFGISDAALVSGARMFVGMRASSTPANAEPSTLTNCIGMGHGASDTTMHIYYGGSSAQTPIDLGANFPVDTNTTPYELALFSPPGEARVNWQVTNLATGNTASGTVTGDATVLPQESTLLAPWGYRTNNATAAAAGLDVMSAYIETDR